VRRRSGSKEVDYILALNTMLRAVNPCRRGRISIVDLIVLTGLDQLLFILKILLTFVSKQATLMRRSIILSLYFSLGSKCMAFKACDNS
jgi:hypothetical protein